MLKSAIIVIAFFGALGGVGPLAGLDYVTTPTPTCAGCVLSPTNTDLGWSYRWPVTITFLPTPGGGTKNGTCVDNPEGGCTEAWCEWETGKIRFDRKTTDATVTQGAVTETLTQQNPTWTSAVVGTAGAFSLLPCNDGATLMDTGITVDGAPLAVACSDCF